MLFRSPAGQRIQQIFVGDEPLAPTRIYNVAFVTEQGVSKKYGHLRSALEIHAVEAMQNHLKKHKPMFAELRGTFNLV